MLAGACHGSVVPTLDVVVGAGYSAPCHTAWVHGVAEERFILDRRAIV